MVHCVQQINNAQHAFFSNSNHDVELIPHFPVLHFPSLRFWFCNFQSCIFSPAFSVSYPGNLVPSSHVSRSLIYLVPHLKSFSGPTFLVDPLGRLNKTEKPPFKVSQGHQFRYQSVYDSC